MVQVYKIDNQPMAAGFFNEVKNLTDFITPDSLEVTELYHQLTSDIISREERILACWNWVASNVRYVKTVKGRLWINGRTSVQHDLWQEPAMVINTLIGNCANKSFLLTSLLRNELPPEDVFCVLGNIYNGTAGGHAWLQVKLNDQFYTMESTTPLAPPLVPIEKTRRYQAVHFFNDKTVQAVEGRTQMVPFNHCSEKWVAKYLHSVNSEVI